MQPRLPSVAVAHGRASSLTIVVQAIAGRPGGRQIIHADALTGDRRGKVRLMMKLYITPGSPYARIARIMVLEKQLENRVEIIPAQTRAEDSPYYRINPSGRVPYLVRDDGVGLEESAVISRYMDHLEGKPEFDLPTGAPGWEALRLGALASSLVDGLSVWGRAVGRPQNERSPTIIRHETERARRSITGRLKSIIL